MQFRLRLILPHQLLCDKSECINRKRYKIMVLLLLLSLYHLLSSFHNTHVFPCCNTQCNNCSSMRHIKCSLSKRKRKPQEPFPPSCLLFWSVVWISMLKKRQTSPKMTHPAVGNQSTVTQNRNKTGITEHTMEEKQISTSFIRYALHFFL